MAVKRTQSAHPEEGRIVVYFDLDRRDNRELFDHLACFAKGPKRCSQLRFLASEGLYAIGRGRARANEVPSAKHPSQNQSASAVGEATERFCADGIFSEPLVADTPTHSSHTGRLP